MNLLRLEDVGGGLPEDVFTLLGSDRLLFEAVSQLLREGFREVEDSLVSMLGLETLDEDSVELRDYALQRIAAALGEVPVQESPGSSTYLISSGVRFHVRTMKRYPRPNQWYSYWFGVRETLWVPGEVFVFQCGLAGSLIVPASDWLPFKAKLPLAKAGTPDASVQPALWRNNREFELRVADSPNRVTDEGKLDARAWLDRFDYLTTPGEGTGVKSGYWWVNQGKNYARERDGGYLYASKTTKGGAIIAMHANVGLLAPGDVVFHYAQGAVRAISTIADVPVESMHPAPPVENWEEPGHLATASYFELAQPIQLNAIPIDYRVKEKGPFMANGGVKQGYLFPLSPEFAEMMQAQFASSWPPGSPLAGGDFGIDEVVVEPDFTEIESFIAKVGLRIDSQTLRRYHLSLRTRGFVILTGISGTGKTWLAEAYAEAVSAEQLVVPVAPNWTTNEDLLGYFNPIDNTYHDTPFSAFLRSAAHAFSSAKARGTTARPYHLILDEMNLARVEYYFAKFLSAMELRSRRTTTPIELAPGEEVLLTPNLKFIGTVNIDETTHGFADKVFDRAQLVGLTVRSRSPLRTHRGCSVARHVDGHVGRSYRRGSICVSSRG